MRLDYRDSILTKEKGKKKTINQKIKERKTNKHKDRHIKNKRDTKGERKKQTKQEKTINQRKKLTITITWLNIILSDGHHTTAALSRIGGNMTF